MASSSEKRIEGTPFEDFALFLILITKNLYKIMFNQNEFLSKIKISDNFRIQNWLKYYQNHRIIEEKVLELFFDDIEADTEVSEIFINLLRWGKCDLNEDIKGILELAHGIKKEQSNLILKKVHEPIKETKIKSSILDSTKMPQDLILECVNSPEFVFFVRVCIPCWIFYGDEAAKIYRRARLGDINSICDLLRLDKVVIYDRKISKVVIKLSMNPDSNQFKLVGNAFKGRPKKISDKKYKNNIAALISKYFSNFGIKPTAPQIIELFDKESKLTDSQYSSDPDFEIQPDSFARNIRRNRPFWNIFPDPDKK